MKHLSESKKNRKKGWFRQMAKNVAAEISVVLPSRKAVQYNKKKQNHNYMKRAVLKFVDDNKTRYLLSFLEVCSDEEFPLYLLPQFVSSSDIFPYNPIRAYSGSYKKFFQYNLDKHNNEPHTTLYPHSAKTKQKPTQERVNESSS